MSYTTERTWSDKYLIDHLSKILPDLYPLLPHTDITNKFILTSEAPDYEDQTQATDIVAQMSSLLDDDGSIETITFGMRDRRYNGHSKYLKEFTVRSKTRYNSKTELEKILQGYGDFNLYCWTTNDEITDWTLLDLDAFRFHMQWNRSRLKYTAIPNHDGTEFYAFDITSFPSDEMPIVVASTITGLTENAWEPRGYLMSWKTLH